MSTTSPGRCVLVLGMHRSGTSAVAGALGACGVELGARLIDAAPDNPQGYFENTDAVLTDDQLLDDLDRAWDDVRAMPQGWLTSEAARVAGDRIRSEVVSRFVDVPAWAIKDPRMCRVLPLWTRELESARLDVVGLLVLRHPDEVAASLRRRDGMHRRAAHLLWLRHVLESAAAAPEATVCLRYEQVLDDPASTLAAAGRRLGLDLDVDDRRLRDLLREDSRHHRGAATVPGDAWEALSREVYASLAEADWREKLPDLQARFAVLEAHEADWIDAIGMAAREADRRRRRADAQAREALQRADVLQKALDDANAIAEQHARDLAAADLAGRETSRGLARAEALARDRAQEAEALAAELQLTQQALVRAEALARERAQEAEALAAELQLTQQALVRAEALARERAQEAEALAAELQLTQQALVRAEAIVQARTHEAATLSNELAATQGALASVEGVALQRLRDWEDVTARYEAELGARLAAEEQASRLRSRVEVLDSRIERITRSRLWPAFSRMARLAPDTSDE